MKHEDKYISKRHENNNMFARYENIKYIFKI